MKHLKRIPLWRLIALAAVAAVFALFFYPLATGYLDLCNLSVMLGCGLLAVVLIRWESFVRLLRRLWGKTWGKVLLLTVFGALAAVLILLIVLMILVETKMNAKPTEDRQTLIVLGCQVRGETPSRQLYYRIEAADAYLKAHPDAVAVLSGGMGPDEGITEAECMYRCLTARGIDPSRLYRETESSNTLENLRFSAALMEREGLSGPVLIVTNGFHVYRALKMAKDVGLPAEGLAAESDGPSMPFALLREAMALVKYALVGSRS